MCMIAYRPAGKAGHMPHDVVQTAMSRHPDGFGIAWRDKSGLHVEKYGPSKRGKAHFRRTVQRVDRAGAEYVAHFRWATHGPKDAEHAHPYEYNDPDPKVGKVLLFHNGIIDIATTPRESDTEVFTRDVLTRLESRWWTNPALVYLVTEAIGYSKLTIMTAKETVNLHPKRGDWDGGVWYSSNHKPSQASKWTPVAKPVMHNDPGKGTTTGASGTDYAPQYHVYMAKGELTQGWWDDAAKTWVERKAPEGMKMGDRGPAPVQLLAAPVSVSAPIKSAKDSAVALGLVAPSVSTTGMGSDACSVVVDPRKMQRWRNGEHVVSALQFIDILGSDREYLMAVVCDDCRTMGDAWVIDGEVYIDIGHADRIMDGDDYEGMGE